MVVGSGVTLLVHVVVGLLLVIGLAGSLVPVIPGTALILGGVALHSVATGFDPIGPWRLLAFGALGALALALDYVAGAAGVKRFGGSGWATAGALLGAVVGIFLGPLGLVLGPVAGAVLFEWLYCRRLRDSVRSGMGTLFGLLLGAVAKFGLAVVMVSLFLFWVWRG